MGQVRIEWVSVRHYTGLPDQGFNSFGALDLDVGATATASAERPVAPSFGASMVGYARVVAIQGSAIVEVGSDPTASSTSGVRVDEGREVLVPVRTGDKISVMAPAGQPVVKVVSIASGQSLSGILDLRSAEMAQIYTPTAWTFDSTSPTVGFARLMISADGVDFRPVENGTPGAFGDTPWMGQTIGFFIRTSVAYQLSRGAMRGTRYLRFQATKTDAVGAAAMVQAAQRDFTIVTVPLG